jgi:hypothetical protein
MSEIHEKIVTEVELFWTQQNRGCLFKNHNGMAFSKAGIPIKYGLQEGSSDLIGWEYVRIEKEIFDNIEIEFKTKELWLPIICSIEVKTLKYPKFSQKQIAWLNHVADIGGMAYSAMEIKNRKSDEILWQLKKWEKR